MPRITPQSWKTLEKVFIQAGFKFERQSSSHLIYVKKGVNRPFVIPKYKEISVIIIRGLLKTAGISRKEYFDYLDSI